MYKPWIQDRVPLLKCLFKRCSSRQGCYGDTMHNICNVEISPDSYPNSAFEYPSNPDDDVTLMMQLVLNTGVGGGMSALATPSPLPGVLGLTSTSLCPVPPAHKEQQRNQQIRRLA